ncbi:unnamed protein product [Cunninghamella echinulata]
MEDVHLDSMQKTNIGFNRVICKIYISLKHLDLDKIYMEAVHLNNNKNKVIVNETRDNSKNKSASN